MTPTRWIEKMNAIGITSKAGKYGGTYAHVDIAFEFASWISPQFKLYLIEEVHEGGLHRDGTFCVPIEGLETLMKYLGTEDID